MSDPAELPVDGVETVGYTSGADRTDAAAAPRLRSAVPADLEQIIADLGDGPAPRT
ncbi:hypothetical protein [Streptomyces atratus]|uniref:hypothetical protein n=1 Tax=Streptomyces atratus TaxID=1893 RepID=UPI0021A89D37|nr:hypothetical protein [Streptomyces atratus]MCT2542319.1 hypothetical protein [Streptomyces atratus]